MSKNEPLLNKIRALLSKTVENGCTEAEAIMAASKAAEMMDRHGFDTSDLDIKEIIKETTYFAPGRHLGPVSKIIVHLSAYCDVKVWARRAPKYSGGSSGIIFFGRESDIAVASYLTHLLASAFETEWKSYFSNIKGSQDHNMHGRAIRASFESGMAIRINSRLQEMKVVRNKTVDAASGKCGHDLVVVKNKDVEDAFKALSMKLSGGSKQRYSAANTAAYGAGMEAGSRVNIVSGVNGGKKILGIC